MRGVGTQHASDELAADSHCSFHCVSRCVCVALLCEAAHGYLASSESKEYIVDTSIRKVADGGRGKCESAGIWVAIVVHKTK